MILELFLERGIGEMNNKMAKLDKSLVDSLPAINLLDMGSKFLPTLDFEREDAACKYLGRCEGCLGFGELDKYCYNNYGYGCSIQREKDLRRIN